MNKRLFYAYSLEGLADSIHRADAAWPGNQKSILVLQRFVDLMRQIHDCRQAASEARDGMSVRAHVSMTSTCGTSTNRPSAPSSMRQSRRNTSTKACCDISAA